MLSLRPATAEDAPAIGALLEQMGYPADAAGLEARLAAISRDAASNVVLVAVLGIDIVGVVAGHRIPLLQQGTALGRITALAVDQGRRGHGAGRRLMAAIEIWFSDHGANRIEITSAEQRADAHRFFQSLGYREKRLRLIKDRN